MRYYEITISNGNYPLSYKCSTIAEAFGCLMEVSTWATHVHFEPDGIMELLVSMKSGETLSHEAYGYRIEAKEGEA